MRPMVTEGFVYLLQPAFGPIEGCRDGAGKILPRPHFFAPGLCRFRQPRTVPKNSRRVRAFQCYGLIPMTLPRSARNKRFGELRASGLAM